MKKDTVNIIDQSFPNQWGAAKNTIKVLLLPFVPAYALPTLFFYLIIPIGRPVFLAVFILQIALYFTKLKWGVGFTDLPRFMKAQLNQNKLHGHRYHRRKSGTSLWGMAFASLFVLSVFQTPEAYASYEIIIPKKESGNTEPSVATTLSQMRMIDRQTIHQGFGHDTPLHMLMRQILPRSFRVHWRDPELAQLPVDWRSYDMDTIEIMEDIANRYGVRFRYSNRSGNVYVEWLDDACVRGIDSANVYTLIC